MDYLFRPSLDIFYFIYLLEQMIINKLSRESKIIKFCYQDHDEKGFNKQNKYISCNKLYARKQYTAIPY